MINFITLDFSNNVLDNNVSFSGHYRSLQLWVSHWHWGNDVDEHPHGLPIPNFHGHWPVYQCTRTCHSEPEIFDRDWL